MHTGGAKGIRGCRCGALGGCAGRWCPASGALPQPSPALARHAAAHPPAARRCLGALNITESLRVGIAAVLPPASPALCQALHHLGGRSGTAAPQGPIPGGFRCPSPAFSTQRCWQPGKGSVDAVERASCSVASPWGQLWPGLPESSLHPPYNVEQGHVPASHAAAEPPGCLSPPSPQPHQAENAPSQGRAGSSPDGAAPLGINKYSLVRGGPGGPSCLCLTRFGVPCSCCCLPRLGLCQRKAWQC